LQSNFYGRGGIVFWADLVGAKHIYNSLKKWTQLYGNFYKPSRYLEERATKGIPLVRFLISFVHEMNDILK
jgi:enoyl-CoA hydratase/3-hydroxyacyl-CoA dehydrogenase